MTLKGAELLIFYHCDNFGVLVMVFSELIDADSLKADWSNNRRWQELLPELMMMLIKASVQDSITEFPAGTSISLPGFDGTVSSNIRHKNFVPRGDSEWEVGSDKNAYVKALKDMKKRVAEKAPELAAAGIVPAASNWNKLSSQEKDEKRKQLDEMVDTARTETALVFVVTGSENASKTAFEHYCDMVGDLWSEIIVLTATNIYDWLISFPAVHAWLSYQLGSYHGGARPIEAVLQEWENATSPRLSASFFEATGEWNGFYKKIKDSVGSGEKNINVIRSSNDSLEKICHALSLIPDAVGRSLVIDNSDAWFALSASPNDRLILVCAFDGPPLSSRAQRGPTVFSLISPLNSFQALEKTDFLNDRFFSLPIKCPEIKTLDARRVEDKKTQHNMRVKKNLVEFDAATAGLKAGSADDIRRGANRAILSKDALSLTGSEIHSLARDAVLFRKRAMVQSPPVWTPEAVDPPGVAGLLLAGSWDDSNQADRKILEELTRVDYFTLESWLSSKKINTFFPRVGSIYTVDPYTLDDTDFPAKLSREAISCWQKIIISLIYGRKKTLKLSPELQKGLLSTLVRFAMLNEKAISRNLSSSVIAISTALFVDSEIHSGTGMIWDRPGGKYLLHFIWEAFPSSTLKRLEVEPFESMYWKEGIPALECLSRSRSYADRVSAIALEPQFFEHFKNEATDLAAKLFSPIFPLLNNRQTSGSATVIYEVAELEKLSSIDFAFFKSIVRETLLGTKAVGSGGSSGVRHWDHRWVNDETYWNNFYVFWKLALEFKCLTVDEVFSETKKYSVHLDAFFIKESCSCSFLKKKGCTPNESLLGLLANFFENAVRSPDWNLGRHFDFEILLCSWKREYDKHSRDICSIHWGRLNWVLSLSRKVVSTQLLIFHSAPTLQFGQSPPRPVGPEFLSAGSSMAIRTFSALPKKYLAAVDLKAIGSFAAKNTKDWAPCWAEINSWNPSIRRGFLESFDFKKLIALREVPDAELKLQATLLAEIPLTAKRQEWIEEAWPSEMIVRFYSSLKEADPEDALLLVKEIATVLKGEALGTLCNVIRNAYEISNSETQRGMVEVLIKTIEGASSVEHSGAFKGWYNNNDFTSLVRAIDNSAEDTWLLSLGELVFNEGGEVTPSLASALYQDADLAVKLLLTRPGISSISYFQNFDYCSNGLLSSIRLQPGDTAMWVEEILDLAHDKTSSQKIQINEFAASILGRALTASDSAADQAPLLELIEKSPEGFWVALFGTLSPWVGPAISIRIERRDGIEEQVINERKTAQAIAGLLEREKTMSRRLRQKLNNISSSLSGNPTLTLSGSRTFPHFESTP